MPITRERNNMLLTYIENIVNSTTLYTEHIFDWMEHKGRNLFDIDSVNQDFFRQGKIKLKKQGNDEDDDNPGWDFEFDCPASRSKFIVPYTLYKDIILAACQAERENVAQDTEFEQHLTWLKTIFNLSNIEYEVLKLYAYLKRSPIIHTFVDDILSSRHRYRFSVKEYPEILASSERELNQVLSIQGTLLKAGVLTMEDQGYEISNLVYNLLSEPLSSAEDMRQVLTGTQENASIHLNCFKFLGNNMPYIKKLLGNAMKSKEKGINILFAGKPGTGKTEFAKTLAKALKTNLYSVCDGRNNNKEPVRKDRIYALKTSDFVLGKSKGILLLDEAEDIFISHFFCMEETSKSFMNQQLENNKHPVIWTSNSLKEMDSAHLRRFTYIIQFPEPDEKVRGIMWKNACLNQHVFLGKKEISNLAKSYQVPPAIINLAVKNAKLTNGGVPEIKMTLSSFAKALNTKYEIAGIDTSGVAFNSSATTFDPKLLNTDINLEKLAEQLSFAKRSFSLCLYGAAGTGKSAYARYIADKLKMPVLEKRASDLMDKYVGETEKRIAAAFAEAKDKKAMLIFDEADSLLRDRTNAVRSWEVSQVNEMLTWMESHPLPFVCTTNLMDGLDKASLRRFTFKVKYNYLTVSQVVGAFAHFFNLTVTEDEAYALSHLAPGDFVVVKNKANILNCLDDKAEIIKMLKSEIEIKGEIPRSAAVGFL